MGLALVFSTCLIAVVPYDFKMVEGASMSTSAERRECAVFFLVGTLATSAFDLSELDGRVSSDIVV
jgi:hypothetical protein